MRHMTLIGFFIILAGIIWIIAGIILIRSDATWPANYSNYDVFAYGQDIYIKDEFSNEPMLFNLLSEDKKAPSGYKRIPMNGDLDHVVYFSRNTLGLKAKNYNLIDQ